MKGIVALLMGIALTMANPVDAEAKLPDAAEAKHSVRLVMLGTAGGPVIRLNRSQPSTLLVVDGHPYMIDAGIGSLRNLVAAGFTASDIDAIFITHQHLDHTGGLADIIQSSSFGARSEPVRIVGPLGVVQMVKASLDLLEPSRRVFGSEGLIKSPDPKSIYMAKDIVSPGVQYEDSNIKVSAVENSHYRLEPGTPSYGRDRSYSYRVETPNGVIVFTGDSGPSAAMTELAKGADVLVTEVINVEAAVNFAASKMHTDAASRQRIAEHMAVEHLTPEEVGKMAGNAKVKMVILTHFGPGSDDEKSSEAYVAGIRKFYSGPVIATRDMDEIILPVNR